MTLAELFVRLSADTSDFGPKIKDVQKQLDSVQSSVEKLGSALTNFGTRLTAAVSVPLAGVGVAALKMSSDMEQASMAFKTMMGSAAAAQVHLEQLKKFAAQTPFEFADLVVASKRMQALGFTADQVLPSLRSIGNAASALGMGKEGIDRITLALGQMLAKTKVQGEEMRQLAEAGIPAWQILAKTLNTDVAGAMSMVEHRAVDATVAVPALLEGMNKKFNGLMEQQMQTIGGMWSNLKDSIGFTLADIGKAMTPWAKDIMTNILQPMLDKMKDLAAAFGAMNPKAQSAAIGFGALAVAGPPVIAALGYMIQGIGTFGKALTAVIPAITSPAGIAVAIGVTLVGAITAMIYKLTQVNSELDKSFAKFEQFQRAKAIQDKAAAGGMVGPANATDWSEFDITKDAGASKGISRGISVAPVTDTKAALEGATKAAEEFAAKWAKAMSTLGMESSKFREMEEALAVLAMQLRAHGVEVPKTANVYWLLMQAVQAHVITLSQAQQAMKAWGLEWDKNHPKAQQVALDFSENKTNVDAFIRAMQVAASANAGQWIGKVSANVQELLVGLSSLPSPRHWFDQLAQSAAAAGVKVEDAFIRLGIKSQAELKQIAAEAKRDYNIIASDAKSTALDIERAWVAMIEAQIRAGAKLSPATLAEYEKIKKASGDASKQVDSHWKAGLKQVSTAITDLSRSLTDVIFGTKSIGEAFVDLGKTIVRIILEQIIAAGIAKLMKSLVGVTDQLGSIGKAMGGIFGGAAGSVASAGAGAATSAAGAASSAGGVASAAGTAVSGVMGIVGAVGSVATAVSSIIGNFQMAGMNKSLDLIEASTRYTWLAVGSGSASISEMMKNLWAWAQTQEKTFWGVTEPLLVGISANTDAMVAYLGEISKGKSISGGSGSATYNTTINVQGAGDPNAVAQAVIRAIPGQLKLMSPAFSARY